MPYLVVVSVHVFKFVETGSARFYKAAFCLAMANSGVNPLIYAWKNAAFRKAFGKLLRCQRPDLAVQEPIESIRSTNHHRSSLGINRQETINSLRTDFGTPPSSARARAGSSDLETGIDMPVDMQGPRGSITDSGVVVIMKHKRLSSISSEHRNSQTTISEETCSNHTTVVMFSTSQDNESDYMETPKKTLENNRNAKLIRNKCAILESFDSISDESLNGESKSSVHPYNSSTGYQKTCVSPPPSPLAKQHGPTTRTKVQTKVVDTRQNNGANNNNKSNHKKFIFNLKKSFRVKVKQPISSSLPPTSAKTTKVTISSTQGIVGITTTATTIAPTSTTYGAKTNNNKSPTATTVVVAQRYKVNENVESVVVGKL